MDKAKQIADHESTIEVLNYLQRLFQDDYFSHVDLEIGLKTKQFLTNNIAQLTKTLETLKATP